MSMGMPVRMECGCFIARKNGDAGVARNGMLAGVLMGNGSVQRNGRVRSRVIHGFLCAAVGECLHSLMVQYSHVNVEHYQDELMGNFWLTLR